MGFERLEIRVGIFGAVGGIEEAMETVAGRVERLLILDEHLRLRCEETAGQADPGPRAFGLRDHRAIDREKSDRAAAEIQEEVARAGYREAQPRAAGIRLAAGVEVQLHLVGDAADAGGPLARFLAGEDVPGGHEGGDCHGGRSLRVGHVMPPRQ